MVSSASSSSSSSSFLYAFAGTLSCIFDDKDFSISAITTGNSITLSDFFLLHNALIFLIGTPVLFLSIISLIRESRYICKNSKYCKLFMFSTVITEVCLYMLFDKTLSLFINMGKPGECLKIFLFSNASTNICDSDIQAAIILVDSSLLLSNCIDISFIISAAVNPCCNKSEIKVCIASIFL